MSNIKYDSIISVDIRGGVVDRTSLVWLDPLTCRITKLQWAENVWKEIVDNPYDFVKCDVRQEDGFCVEDRITDTKPLPVVPPKKYFVKHRVKKSFFRKDVLLWGVYSTHWCVSDNPCGGYFLDTVEVEYTSKDFATMICKQMNDND